MLFITEIATLQTKNNQSVFNMPQSLAVYAEIVTLQTKNSQSVFNMPQSLAVYAEIATLQTKKSISFQYATITRCLCLNLY